MNCTELFDDLTFEEQVTADLPQGDYDLAVVVPADGTCPEDIALVRVAPVGAAVTTNLVVVDEDTTEIPLNPQIYAIIGGTNPLLLQAPAETQ